ncbi:ferredoxin--NADP reductase [Enterococcus florum]|uniref:Ferredoxin--NADP reductase n=1 Tax=Enterococcus florum TaxID=2480627 RepID=A0A4V0WPR7_9ENTE|nr:NAD(P)/FAD-dependent oxidoreductase [Enterococcus florum]GCF94799.1 ferredoxin--NADP reductase [Enterococcus florum]
MELFDITIVGAGPVGMFAAFYAGMRQRKTKLIDSLPQLGGQLTTLYPEKHIYDIPGFPEIKAADLIGNLEKQLQTFTHTYCLEEEVIDLKKHENYLELITNKGSHFSKAVILALGNGSFQPRRLQVARSEVFENKGIDYYVTDLMKYAGKKVAIAGGGDSAIDWALMLEPIAEKVSIIHRRNQFRGHEHSVEKLKSSTIEILTPYVVTGVSGEQMLDTVTLQKMKSDETMELNVDHLIVNYGFTSSLDHLKSWGLDSTRQAIVVNSDMSTSVPGVYACGDITTYDGKVRLIATGSGEAPTAVNNALHYIDPETRRQPVHSSSLFPKIQR